MRSGEGRTRTRERRREGRLREMKERERKVINIDGTITRERIKYNKKLYKLATVTSYM